VETQPSALLKRRALPGGHHSISVLTFSVEPPWAAPPSADDRAVLLLRKARLHGVTTFDVSRAQYAPRAERLIARAFPSDDGELSVIVGRSVEHLVQEDPTRGPSSAPVSDLSGMLEESLNQSRSRLAPVPISIVEWDSASPAAPRAAVDPAPISPPEARSGNTVWSVGLAPRASELPEVPPSTLFSGEFSLLETNPIRVFQDTTHPTGRKLLARNPFADGRLDGSRFGATGGLATPGQAPVDVRRLHEEFDPVIRLGFLTAGRRRTMAQAALEFVLSWPWVLTTVLPMPDPERIDEILGFARRPPISSEEFSQLGFVK
jgi:aryl-alcohol dehydrogenase-like predicted oxidoreductase